MAFVHEPAAPRAPAADVDGFALLTRWNYSLTAFYLRRLRRQMEFPMTLMGVSSPDDLAEARRVFESDLQGDYCDQAAALHRMVSVPGATSRGQDYGAELLKAQEDARELLDQAKSQAERIVASARERAAEILAQAAPEAKRRSGHAA